MTKRLKDFKIENHKDRPEISRQIVSIQFENDEATRRMVMHSAKRVILQHKDEIQELAYK